MAAKQILIIDDDKDLCKEIAEALRENGYSVQKTSDPLEGRDFIVKHHFDVVFVDYKMPHLNGIEMLRIIKDKDPETKIFIMSGSPSIERFLEEEKAAHLVDGIIHKPFEEKDLLDRIG